MPAAEVPAAPPPSVARAPRTRGALATAVNTAITLPVAVTLAVALAPVGWLLGSRRR